MDFKEKWRGITDWRKKLSGSHGKMTKGNWIVLLCTGLLFLIAAMPSKGAAGSWREMLGLEGGTDQAEGYVREGNGADGQYWGGFSGDGAEGRKGEGGGSGGRNISEMDGAAGTEAAAGGKKVQTADGGGIQEAYLYTYEALMEQRVKEILAKVEGVGEVDVLIVLKSSEQKVYQTDGKSLYSSTKEQDASGGVREIAEQEEESSTVLVDGSGVGLHAGLGSGRLYSGMTGAAGGENGGSAASGGTGASGPLLEKELRPEVSGIVISAQGGGEATVQAEITAAMEALFDLPAHKIKVLKRAE